MGGNGLDHKTLAEELEERKEYVLDTIAKVHDNHTLFEKLADSLERISDKLDHINTSITIGGEKIHSMETTFVTAIVGKNQLPIESVKTIARVYGWIIFGLVIIIVFLATGMKLKWLPGI